MAEKLADKKYTKSSHFEFNFQTIKTYLINLDRRTDRWNTFLESPLANLFQRLERYSAFDGKTLDLSGESRISLHTRDNIRKGFRRSHFEINTKGACGASFSHIGVWKKFLETDEEYCLVLEDDIFLRKEDFDLADILKDRIPREFDIWILGYHPYSATADRYMKGSPWGKVKRFTGAHCYILSRKGAEGLLKECFPIETHIEFYMTTAAKEQGLLMLVHDILRVPQRAEFTEDNDSDTALQRTCPLCNIPDDPNASHIILPKASFFQAGISVAVLSIMGYGIYRVKSLSGM
jgi:hypothetical protein